MGIMAECPYCHRKQSVRNKVCGCGADLDKLKKQKEKVKYWISYRLPGGRQKRHSVDTFKDLNGYSIEDARKADAKRTVQKAENRIMDIKPDSKMTFNELAEWYLDLEKVKALASYETIKIYLNKFNKVFGNTTINKVKAADLENHQEKRKKEGYKPKTIDDELNYMKTIIIKAFDNDIVGGDTLKAFRKVKPLLSGKQKGSNARSRILKPEEIKAIRDNVKEQHTLDLFDFGYWTGARAGEVMKLKWGMVDLQKRIMTLSGSITKEGKEKKIPIGQVVYEILTRDNKHIRKAGEVDNVFTYWGKPITRAFTTGFKTASKISGIQWGRDIEGGWIFHDLRRTFKTEARKAGIHKSVIDAIVGHSSSNDMDSRYNIIDDQDRLDAIRNLEKYREAEFASVDHTVDQIDKMEDGKSLKANDYNSHESL